jgi:hypothetical protein
MKNTGKPDKKAVTGQNGDEGEGTPIEVPEITYQLPPDGMQAGRCVWAIDIGTHLSNFSNGGKQRKVVLGFELPLQKTIFDPERGEEPFLLSNIYTMSVDERSNLYRDLAAWQGKGAIQFLRKNLAALLGKPCLLNVQYKTTKKNQLRASIIGINPLPKGTRIPAQITPSLKYSISDAFGGCYNNLPGWVQKFIDDSEELADANSNSSVEAKTERNVRKAAANAKPRPHRPVEINEPTSDELAEQLNAELEPEEN